MPKGCWSADIAVRVKAKGIEAVPPMSMKSCKFQFQTFLSSGILLNIFQSIIWLDAIIWMVHHKVELTAYKNQN